MKRIVLIFFLAFILVGCAQKTMEEACEDSLETAINSCSENQVAVDCCIDWQRQDVWGNNFCKVEPEACVHPLDIGSRQRCDEITVDDL